MTRIVQALARDGLVRREADPADGRVVRLRATAKGKRVMQRGRDRRVEKLAELLARLKVDEIAQIRKAADLVEQALAQQA